MSECECGETFTTWQEWQKHSQRPNGYSPPGPGTHRRILRADPEAARNE